jgi:CDP-glucose 4,6-dehydratase
LDDQVCGEWNFGPEINIENTVAKVANLAATSWGGDAGWSVGSEPQPHEAGYLLLDSTKARTNLGWADKLEFSEAIKWSMEFYKDVESGISPRKALEDQIQTFLSL